MVLLPRPGKDWWRTGRQLSDMLARIAADTRTSPLTRPPKFDGRDRYFPLQGRRTTISISTLISGL